MNNEIKSVLSEFDAGEKYEHFVSVTGVKTTPSAGSPTRKGLNTFALSLLAKKVVKHKNGDRTIKTGSESIRFWLKPTA